MSKKQTELFIWFSKELWSKDNQTIIHDKFSSLGAKKDIKASIGAGAQGPLPELSLLLIISASIIASGFLNAIGEDLWTDLKKILFHFPKHKKLPLTDYPGVNTEATELILWIHWGSYRLLVTFALTDEAEINKAFCFF